MIRLRDERDSGKEERCGLGKLWIPGSWKENKKNCGDFVREKKDRGERRTRDL
jgi:hypothetical protein